MIARRLMIADSNGRPAWLPGDTTSNPNNPVFQPFYTAPVVGAFECLHVSEETTGQLFVTLWKNNQQVSAPILLYGGVTVNISADKIVPVGVRRAGEVWLQLSDQQNAFTYTRGEQFPVSRGVQANVYPLTQIPLYTGGPLSNLWCHPLSAPGSASPMVLGTAGRLAAGAHITRVGYTAANWAAIYLAFFNVDPDTQSVVNVRRMSGALPATEVGISVNSFEINAWDRIGMIAIPSAANPNPALAPATVFQVVLELLNTYSRSAEFGYLGIGMSNELV